MLRFTLTIDDQPAERRVRVAGVLDVHNATEFNHVVRQLREAAGTRASFDLTQLRVLDEAARAAVRGLVREAEEFGGDVTLPYDVGVAGRPD